MKPAQKLKARGWRRARHRKETTRLCWRTGGKQDAVKSRRAFLRFVLVTVYLVVWGVSVLAFWMGGRTDAMGYSLVVFYAVPPVEHAGAVLFHRMRRRGTAANGQCCSFLER